MSTLIRESLNVVVNKHCLRLASEYRPKNHLDTSNEKRQSRIFSCISRNITELFYDLMNLEALNEHRSKRRKLGESLEDVRNELIRRYGVQEGEKDRWITTFDRIVAENKDHFCLLEPLLVSNV